MNNLQEIRKQIFKTNITGLNELLRGGFVLPTQNNADNNANGLVILVKGKPGTGKTTLAMQLFYDLTQEIKMKIEDYNKRHEKGFSFDERFSNSQYFSIEQSQDELEEKLMNLVICQIFNDMQDFVVINASILGKYPQNELENISIHLNMLKLFFPVLEEILLIPSDANSLKNYTTDNYSTLKFFFENFKYDRVNKKIIAIKNFKEADDLYDFNEIQSIANYLNDKDFESRKITFHGEKIISVKDYKEKLDLFKAYEKEFTRVEFSPNLTESFDENIIDELIGRLSKYYTINTKYQLDSKEIERLVISIAKEKEKGNVNNYEESIKNLKIDKDLKKSDVIVKYVYKEFISLIQSHYFSHLPKDFSVNIKTADSVQSKADSPFNFMSIQKVHDFINEIEDESKKDSKFYPCIVLDGLNILSEKEKKLINIGKLVKALKNNSFFNILVYDGEIDGSLYQDYFADLVIDLKGDVEKTMADYFLHQIQITKSRFQQAALGWHQYKIREHGIQVFRSVHFHVHINNYQADQLLESFNPAIISKKFASYFYPDPNLIGTANKSTFPTNIEKILIDPEPGSFTAIFGARATFKTTLTLKFLYNINQKEQQTIEDALLVSLIDNYETLKDSSYCPMAKFLLAEPDNKMESEQCKACSECHKHLFIMHQRSGCVNSHEFFHNLDKRVSDHKKKTGNRITRMAFWDLAQLEYRFPLLAADPMFLPGLIEYTKKKKIALIVMGAGNSKLTPAASAIADNVIFCWRSQIIGQGEKFNKMLKANHLENLEPKLKPGKNVLCLYVDRCQGQLANEGKEFSFIRIDDDRGIEIRCPRNVREKNSYSTTGFTKVANYGLIEDAKETIDGIIAMQGMSSVNK